MKEQESDILRPFCEHVFMFVSLTFSFDPLSISHQTVFKVSSSANNSITADYTALDVTSGNTNQLLIRRLLY